MSDILHYDALELAKAFHNAYEEMAPAFDYKTKTESAGAWDGIPENNQKLMIATCARIMMNITLPQERTAIAQAVAEYKALLQEAHDEMDRANKEYGGALNVKSIPNCFWCAADDYDDEGGHIHDVGCIVNRLEAK